MSNTTLEGTVIPADVQAFAVEQKVDGYILVVLEAASRNFPGARVGVQLYEDHEVEGQRQVQVDVLWPTLDVEQTLRAIEGYRRDLFAAVPAPLVCVFVLMLE